MARYVVRKNGGLYDVVDTTTGRTVYTDDHKEYAEDSARRRNQRDREDSITRDYVKKQRQPGGSIHGWAGLHGRGY